MRDLWKALTLLVLDQNLRNAVGNAAQFTQREVCSSCTPPLPNLTNQPHVPALEAIDGMFRAKGLFLGTYALAEINRWMIEGGVPFRQALADLRPHLNSIPGGSTPTAPMIESVGVLVADPKLRSLFQTAQKDLHDNGFEITPAEETALRKDFQSGSPADGLAQQIFDLGWTTSSCEGRFLLYNGMFHFNL